MLLLRGHQSIQRVTTSRNWVAEEREYLRLMARGVDKVPEKKQEKSVWIGHVALMTLWTGVMLTAVMAACTALRTHLFIWTVFSPKYLFAMAWAVAWHLGVVVGLGGFVSWLDSW